MSVRIVIAGESQCELFADVCLVADHLSQNISNFCWQPIEKPVAEWKAWLSKINQKNKWHHTGSPIIWKEMLMKGSKAFYIGGASEFLEYCHSYYQFDSFLSAEKDLKKKEIEGLSQNLVQFQQKIKREKESLKDCDANIEVSAQTRFVVCITGASNSLAINLISGLLEMAIGEKCISKIYIHDNTNHRTEFMESLERECSYIYTDNPTKVVKYVEKIGVALTKTDLLIILDHVPFMADLSIGDWLMANLKIMSKLSVNINASATRKIIILFPNLGPACYNATILSRLVNISTKNIIVATADLGLEISSLAAEIASVPMRNMFCPPVWGFVGINHLVDIRTTVHKYNTFEPYNRYTKVRNSSLTIGSITPEFRTMEYLMYFDDTLWRRVADNKEKLPKTTEGLNKAKAVLNVVKYSLIEPNTDRIVSLGVECNGSFGLNFNGIFSQPCRFINGVWMPASDYMTPKDPQISIKYLEKIAEFSLNLQPGDLPNITYSYPCPCKRRFRGKKRVIESPIQMQYRF